MLNAKLNMFGDNGSLSENAGKVKDFEQVKRDFETAHASGGDYGPQLLDLSTAIAHSVVRKCLDPQRKTAPTQYKVSNNGFNPAMDELRRGIAVDVALLDSTADAADKAAKTAFDENGDFMTVTADKDAETALNALIDRTLSDGIDLVQTAACALLEQAIDHADGPGWLDRVYTVNRLSRRVYIKLNESAAYRDEQTTPAQEVFRAVRRAVQESRAVQTDPRNGYTYIEDLTLDGLDTIYYRLHKYADLGGTDSNGNYTADMRTAADYDTILAHLNLTVRQAEVLHLRMQGRGYKAIATYLGVTKHAVEKTVKQIQRKAKELGLTPGGEG
ncbi:hypothetical protein [uncultured Oscillibacter sp.]|uniref:helix-turn-helix transcriptional regulator n=1 Tax=uncultured Oscillibacter sp. TaxID=876091 RepID=UPI00262C5931|nr:hypothetical protein [uncultured Oscillibacter sp.]